MCCHSLKYNNVLSAANTVINKNFTQCFPINTILFVLVFEIFLNLCPQFSKVDSFYLLLTASHISFNILYQTVILVTSVMTLSNSRLFLYCPVTVYLAFLYSLFPESVRISLSLALFSFHPISSPSPIFASVLSSFPLST